MTALEMKEEFLTRYDAATSLAAPGWEDSEISKFLNIAQLEIIRELWMNKSFELIYNLVEENMAVAPSIYPDSYITVLYKRELPGDFLYYIRSISIIYIGTNPSSFTVENENISKAVSRQFIADANNRTIFRNPKAYISGSGDSGTLNVIYSSMQNPSGIGIEYIKTPDTIDIENEVGTNLNSDLHDLVVNKAVKLALESVMQSKVQQQG